MRNAYFAVKLRRNRLNLPRAFDVYAQCSAETCQQVLPIHVMAALLASAQKTGRTGRLHVLHHCLDFMTIHEAAPVSTSSSISHGRTFATLICHKRHVPVFHIPLLALITCKSQYG
jgi:hypothetical protein